MAPRRVEVMKHQNSWRDEYIRQQELINGLLQGHGIILHHIGSTSVPGLCAKPIIDILAEAGDLAIFDKKAQELEHIGYIAKGENGIPGRRYFYKLNKDGERLVHLHAFEKGSPHVVRHLAFREYLMSQQSELLRYAEVKETAASKFPWDIEAYIKYKAPVVKEIEEKALIWYKSIHM